MTFIVSSLTTVRELGLKIAYSNAWIALAAGGQVYVCARLMGATPSLTAMALSTLAMFWVYTFAKAVHFDPLADQSNDPGRTAFLLRYRGPLISGGLAGLLLGGWISWRHHPTTLLIFLAPTLIGLFYDLKLLPRGFRYRRLKDVPGLKGTSVALAWTVLTLGLSWAYGLRPDSSLGWPFLVLWNFLMWFINTTYFDLGDIRGDRLEGTQTLPVTLGYSRTRRLLHCLNLASGVLLLLAVMSGCVSPIGVRLVGAILLQALLLSRAVDEESDIGLECDLLADGIFIFSAIAVCW